MVLVCTALFLPLLGSLILVLLSNRFPRRLIEYIGCGSIFLSFLCFLSFLYTGAIPHDSVLFQWIPINNINANFSLHLDHISLFMALIITGVGFLIHVYSRGYMNHEKDIARYFGVMNFFIFSMLLLVLAAHLLLFFVGWEGVGLASYLLIGFWYHRPSAAQAAKKAFVVNRVGDLGLLLGLLLTFQTFGTGTIIEIVEKAQNFSVGAPILTIIALLYFWGATGKSAQIPLHVWLPDAMEGPTPVSALIHAATMVTAGVYLVVRMHPLFLMTPTAMQIVGWVGAITALFAALCATSQYDLKRVLAYSTISQLGYMFLACGVGAFYAALFHLMTHAFTKALLFLSAGNVIHMMDGETNMQKMGGLAKPLKKTSIAFLIGALSMSGIPPLAIFFSKDLILDDALHTDNTLLYVIGLITAVVTAFYLARAYILTFMGTIHTDSKIVKILKEAPQVMLYPVYILACLALTGGFLGYAFTATPPLLQFLREGTVAITTGEDVLHLTTSTWVSIAGAILGIACAAIFYKQLKNGIQCLLKSLYIDALYERCIVGPLKSLSYAITSFFEPKIISGSVQITSRASYATAGLLQHIQSGQIRSYISWIVIGSVILIGVFYV